MLGGRSKKKSWSGGNSRDLNDSKSVIFHFHDCFMAGQPTPLTYPPGARPYKPLVSLNKALLNHYF